MNLDLEKIEPPKRSGNEQFHAGGEAQDFSVLDFWRWSASDLLENTARGVLAEYLVARALGISTEGVREEWGSFDLASDGGLKIEVKSAAYLQSWGQKKLSVIAFRVPRHQGWNAQRGEYNPEVKRHADVYVFALLAHRDKRTVDPLDVEQWRFYVLPAGVLNRRERSQHSITLRSLEAVAGPGVGFHGLRESVERIAREHGLPPLQRPSP
ncbi:MAG TPA: hypothetical protein PKM73_18195 [Verrucomicrobiota bacterium]|nr:hypothetical protein [Verrucomicrobiota bacterium]HNU53125.1 hypothetical protein [Verrucomicrobiota bacterium]